MNSREETEELKILKVLDSRMGLTPKETQQYLNLHKGFEGERKFDEYLTCLGDEWLILNDLRYERNHTEFQIDSLLFSKNTIFLFEVKNYHGDYDVNGDQWFTDSGTNITNPLSQLARCETLLTNLLKEIGIPYPIQSYLVFINSEFTLYGTPRNQTIIYPTQLPAFFTNIKRKSTGFTITEKHMNQMKRLVAKQLRKSAYSRVPTYHFNELKKGIVCTSCHSFMTHHPPKRKIHCMKCGNNESLDSAVLRSIEEFRLLFPERNITTNSILHWCSTIKSKRIIQRILSANFKQIGRTQRSHYVAKNE